MAVGTLLALPAVWSEPLHYDEAVTLEYAVRPFGDIVRSVFVERGGSLVYFFVEHATLAVPGGIEGLRLPNLACFALSIAASWGVGRALFGQLEAALVAFAVATAPLAVSLATFARMYSPFLLLVLVAVLLADRAGRLGGRSRWVAAGAATGLLVHVHPIAPVYILPAVIAAWAPAGGGMVAFLRRAWPAVVAAAIVAAPYAFALGILSSRYDVGRGELLATTAGRSVPEESLRALAPGGTLGAAALAAAAVLGAAWLARTRPRVAVLLVAWVAVPILFFTLVPAGNARFYGRYVLPALPAYLLLAVVGCLAVGTLVRRRVLVGSVLVAALVGVACTDDLQRLDRLGALRLTALVAAVEPGETVLFSSTGTPIADRPPELLDRYVELEQDGLVFVDELPALDPRYAHDVIPMGEAHVASFLRRSRSPRFAAWIFRGPERRVALAAKRLESEDRVETRSVSPTLLLVSTRARASARSLVELGVSVRLAWSIRSPSDRWAHAMVEADRRALAR